MQIILERKNDAFLFEAVNEEGNTIQIDASPSIGGGDEGMRPMQLVASALASCSSIDIINILKKQKQNITGFKVTVDAERKEDETPSVFKSLHLHFVVSGDVDGQKLQKAINLSLEKYCSVAAMLEKTAKITSSFKVV